MKMAGAVRPTAVGGTDMKNPKKSKKKSSRKRLTRASTRQDRSAGDPLALDWFKSDLRLVATDALIYMTTLLRTLSREICFDFFASHAIYSRIRGLRSRLAPKSRPPADYP